MLKEMQIKKIVEENYYKFCHLDGNESIASEFALYTILRLIKKFNVNSVLELGLGIGSISDTVLKWSERGDRDIKYSGTEANEYCRSVLKSNVSNFQKILLYKNLSEIDEKETFDFIIIDGQDDTLNKVSQHCKNETVIFIEGDRSPQRELILTLFPKALYVNIVSLKKNKAYAPRWCNPEHYVGGGQLIFIKPTLETKLFWLIEKTKTFIKREIRNKNINKERYHV